MTTPRRRLHMALFRVVALRGDYSIVLPQLCALLKHHGPISVFDFDAHLDTWLPSKYLTSWDQSLGSDIDRFTHGTIFWMAYEKGLLSETCIHGGLRSRLSGTDFGDYLDDTKQGSALIKTDDIDDLGISGILHRICVRILKDVPVYEIVDGDVINPNAVRQSIPKGSSHGEL